MDIIKKRLKEWKELERNGENPLEVIREKDWNSGELLMIEPYEGFLPFVEFLKENLEEGKILDVGCGSGKHAIKLAEEGYKTYGIDILPEAIELSQKHAKKRGVSKKTKFRTGNVLDLSFDKNKFDGVVDHNLLLHIPFKKWSKYLKNIKKVIKPGGYLYLAELCVDTDKTAGLSPTKEKNEFMAEQGCFHFIKEEEIRQVFTPEFEIIKLYKEEDRVENNVHLIAYLKNNRENV